MSITLREFNPSGNEVIDEVKKRVDALVDYIEGNIEPCRRVSIAVTHFETGAMFAVKAAAVEAKEKEGQTQEG